MSNSIKIKDLPLKKIDEITGDEVIPTGGTGNYGVTVKSLAENIMSYLEYNNKTVQMPFGIEYKQLDLKRTYESQDINLDYISHQVISTSNSDESSDGNTDYVFNIIPPKDGQYRIRMILNGAKSINLNSSKYILDTVYVSKKEENKSSNSQIKRELIFDIDLVAKDDEAIATVYAGYNYNEISI